MKNKACHTKLGFTLLELMLVVIVMGIMLGLAAPNFSKGFSRFQLNKTTDDLISMGRFAQAMAIGQGRPYALVFSDDRHSYNLSRAKINPDTGQQENFEAVKGVLGRKHMVPAAIKLDISLDSIQFYPDGTIDEATIELEAPGQKAALSTTQVRGMLTKVQP